MITVIISLLPRFRRNRWNKFAEIHTYVVHSYGHEIIRYWSCCHYLPCHHGNYLISRNALYHDASLFKSYSQWCYVMHYKLSFLYIIVATFKLSDISWHNCCHKVSSSYDDICLHADDYEAIKTATYSLLVGSLDEHRGCRAARFYLRKLEYVIENTLSCLCLQIGTYTSSFINLLPLLFSLLHFVFIYIYFADGHYQSFQANSGLSILQNT